MELSPPPSEGAYGGEPSPLRTTVSNSAWFLGSPGSASSEPSPLCQPLKSLHLAASSRSLSGEADAGHLVLSVSQVEEFGSQPVETAPQGKRRLAFEGPQELAPSDGSPRIAARHSTSLGGESQHRRSSVGGALQQQVQERQRASTSSYIEFSLSSASLSQLPAALPLRDLNPLASETQHSVQAFPSHNGQLSASIADSIYRNGRDCWQDDDADSSDLGLPFTGHIIAPAANARHLWSPSTDAGPAPTDPNCSLRSSPCLPSGPMPASGSTATLSTPDQGQPGDSGSSAAASSPRLWQLDFQSNRWMQQQHPIFELLTEGQPETAGATAGEESMPASAAAAAAMLLPIAAPEAAACEPLPHVSGSFATPRAQPSSPGAPARPQSASLAQPPAAATAASPTSPGLPPLQHSAWSPVLPAPSSSAAHRRHHSSLPQQAVSSSGGQWHGLPGSSGLERAWSVTGSHLDLKFGTPGASMATSTQHAPQAGATPEVDSNSRGLPFSPRGLQAGSSGVAPGAGAPSLTSMPSSAKTVSHMVGLPQGTYASACQRCKKLDISKARRHVLASPTRRSRVHSQSLMQRLALGCLNPGADQLRWRLGRQRVRLLSLARVPYDADHPVHYALMQAVLEGFAGRAAGSEAWKVAGFTSANPSATDLIGCGVLGLLHMLLLLERRPHLAAELQKAAAGGEGQVQQQEQWHNVSPVLLSVHATLWTAHVLRAGLLSRAAKRLKSTTTAAECFYLGTMECVLEQWREAGGQPQQWQEALHRAELRAKSNVWPMIQRALSI
ncbi:hypothetical protein N2152v2_008839 [Parachlorella kessleri]